jgi:cytoplasmic iron level regulating protein YaaA (DUF328/UPF0246 family)
MRERTLILIPCCGTKNPSGSPVYDGRFCIVNHLTASAGAKLMELRKRVAINFKEESGPDVGFEKQATQIKYMKAYERYCGNLYNRISRDSWEKLNKHQNLSLIIVSAFYGILKHDEFIRNYNREMNRDKIEGVRLKTWWSRQGLCDILLDYITKNRIEVVHDFLSANYSEAIQPFQSKIKEIGLEYHFHDYSGLGSGSNYYRGEDVNRLIQTFHL